MSEVCHRCGGEITAGGESPFCPHCGAPQLYLSIDNQSPETGGERRPEAVDAAGLAIPLQPKQVEWKTAIQCAVLVGGIGAVLSLGSARVALLSPVSTLWIMSGSLIAMGLYERRQPKAWMDAGVGARIGMVVGLCLAVALGVAGAVGGLIERFVLHGMGTVDAELSAQIQRAIKQSASPVPPDMVRWMATPEFHAGMMLLGCAMVAVFLLVFSTLGGAFAGVLRTRRKAAV
jgi:hypothetical protein